MKNQKHMQQAAPEYTTGADGQQLVHVALANSQQRATLYVEDYQRFMEKGFSAYWQYTEDGRGGAYVTLNAYTSRGQNRLIPVARLITDAGHGQRVRASDGNTLNLRNENLTFFAGSAWFNAADWYPTAAAARFAGVSVKRKQRKKTAPTLQTKATPAKIAVALIQPRAGYGPHTIGAAAPGERVRERLSRRAEQVTG